MSKEGARASKRTDKLALKRVDKKQKDVKIDTNSTVRALKKSSSAEIDELFRTVERKTAPPRSPLPPPQPQPDRVDDGFTDTRGARSKARPLTADGLPLFTAEEMKIGQGGDTPNCPFECDCCY